MGSAALPSPWFAVSPARCHLLSFGHSILDEAHGYNVALLVRPHHVGVTEPEVAPIRFIFLPCLAHMSLHTIYRAFSGWLKGTNQSEIFFIQLEQTIWKGNKLNRQKIAVPPNKGN